MTNINTLLRPQWNFDPSWDLGGYSVADFREIWMALLGIARVQRELAVSNSNAFKTLVLRGA
jgi:hypothetical protein